MEEAKGTTLVPDKRAKCLLCEHMNAYGDETIHLCPLRDPEKRAAMIWNGWAPGTHRVEWGGLVESFRARIVAES